MCINTKILKMLCFPCFHGNKNESRINSSLLTEPGDVLLRSHKHHFSYKPFCIFVWKHHINRSAMILSLTNTWTSPWRVVLRAWPLFISAACRSKARTRRHGRQRGRVWTAAAASEPGDRQGCRRHSQRMETCERILKSKTEKDKSRETKEKYGRRRVNYPRLSALGK